MPTKSRRRAPGHLTKGVSHDGHARNGRASANGKANEEHVRSGILRARKVTPKESEEDPQVRKVHEMTYNEWEEFEGQRYTGMKVGSHHKWYYDQGVWREEKMTRTNGPSISPLRNIEREFLFHHAFGH